MFVRLIRGWNFYPVGRVFDVPEGVADLLVNRRQVAEYMPEPAEPPKATKEKRK